jgi:hypothetical protein
MLDATSFSTAGMFACVGLDQNSTDVEEMQACFEVPFITISFNQRWHSISPDVAGLLEV